MIVTVKTSKEVWKSPDGQRSIWEIETPTGEVWQTMSRQIATALGQSLDVTTRVSGTGKTYIVKTPQESPDGLSNANLLPTQPLRGGPSAEDVQRFSAAVDRFQDAVVQFVMAQERKQLDNDDLPPIGNYDALTQERVIEDDLN